MMQQVIEKRYCPDCLKEVEYIGGRDYRCKTPCRETFDLRVTLTASQLEKYTNERRLVEKRKQ